MRDRLKVAFFISSLEAGGAERVVSLLIPELLLHYDVTLILFNNTINYPLPPDVRIIILDQRAKFLGRFLALPFLAWHYKKRCQSLGIEISLSFLNRPNYCAVLAQCMGLHVKMIISERAMPLLQHQYGLKGFVNRLLMRWLYPKAECIIVNSKRNAWVLHNAFGLKNVKTIVNPTTLQADSVQKQKIPFTFITIGRLDEGKNHCSLLEAMVHVNAQLWIIGEGVLRSKLEYQIEKLNLKHKVKLLGYQANPAQWLLQANAFVFSSLYEGFPNVLLEALSCGLPVISTDCLSGPREILAPQTDYMYQMTKDIEVAEFGILVPINDAQAMQKAMQCLIDDEVLYAHYCSQAFKRAQDFAIESIAKQWCNILEGKMPCAE
ncbi:glycosyltransferase [Sulfurospirillum barnesii]|uniref:Glycosyltransferase n=1 Tax=Sulfurospirillum barnesii (strain ATCC 700032 / DSM 10660 / SES-3) TaxID=760154 RepID=I3XYX9_SULBS|nr:glycosyltransferase [Sulfurospirillum barnesii]AFL69153.1 glycosyltransferase [Sulfurospirillum barnesii SES-3]